MPEQEVDYINLIQVTAEQSIKNKDLQKFTSTLISRAHINNWRNPASRKGYHCEDEQKEWGCARHTLRVVKIADTLSRSASVVGLRRDKLISSALLHDCCRYGVHGTGAYTIRDHPLIVCQLLRPEDVVTPDQREVLTLITTHMGPWGPVPFEPGKCLEADLLHYSDMVSAQDFVSIEV